MKCVVGPKIYPTFGDTAYDSEVGGCKHHEMDLYSSVSRELGSRGQTN